MIIEDSNEGQSSISQDDVFLKVAITNFFCCWYLNSSIIKWLFAWSLRFKSIYDDDRQNLIEENENLKSEIASLKNYISKNDQKKNDEYLGLKSQVESLLNDRKRLIDQMNEYKQIETGLKTEVIKNYQITNMGLNSKIVLNKKNTLQNQNSKWNPD